MSRSPRRLLACEVPRSAEGERVDVWLGAREGWPTRSQIKLAAQQGRLLLDGARVRPSRRLEGGEKIELRYGEQAAVDAPAGEPIELDVLFCDDELIAVNKPAGLVVHPAAGHRTGTLVQAVLHRFPSSRWPGEPGRAGIVHRLDKETSGVILIARTAAAHESLSAQFRRRSVEKEYEAIVRGRVSEPGEIDAPIGRHPHERKRMSVASRRARPALTRYQPIEMFREATLLRVFPHSGRTHQIRVHLASRGWPVVGDRVYGGRRGTRQGPLASMKRQALHARSIRFSHPSGDRVMRIRAPRPADFRELLRKLRVSAAPDPVSG